MRSREAIEVVCAHRTEEIAVCAMTGDRWVHEFSPHSLNLSCTAMGGASGVGLGLALAQPERRVWVFDGDGSLLMQLGTLATIVEAFPPNLVHFMLRNGVWYEGGSNLPIPGAKRFDFAKAAEAAGYAHAASFDSVDVLARDLEALLAEPGPTFVELVVEPDSTRLWSKDNLQPELPYPDLYTRMGADARRIRSELLQLG